MHPVTSTAERLHTPSASEFRLVRWLVRGYAALSLVTLAAIVLFAIAGVLLFLPLPGWMVVEQSGCAVLLAAVATIVMRPARGVTKSSTQVVG